MTSEELFDKLVAEATAQGMSHEQIHEAIEYALHETRPIPVPEPPPAPTSTLDDLIDRGVIDRADVERVLADPETVAIIHRKLLEIAEPAGTA